MKSRNWSSVLYRRAVAVVQSILGCILFTCDGLADDPRPKSLEAAISAYGFDLTAARVKLQIAAKSPEPPSMTDIDQTSAAWQRAYEMTLEIGHAWEILRFGPGSAEDLALAKTFLTTKKRSGGVVVECYVKWKAQRSSASGQAFEVDEVLLDLFDSGWDSLNRSDSLLRFIGKYRPYGYEEQMARWGRKLLLKAVPPASPHDQKDGNRVPAVLIGTTYVAEALLKTGRPEDLSLAREMTKWLTDRYRANPDYAEYQDFLLTRLFPLFHSNELVPPGKERFPVDWEFKPARPLDPGVTAVALPEKPEPAVETPSPPPSSVPLGLTLGLSAGVCLVAYWLHRKRKGREGAYRP